MAEWTPEARDYFDGYLRQVGALARGQGDDADDIVAGLREHITNEVEAGSETLVTLDALRKTIASVGTPEQVVSPEFSLSAAMERSRQVHSGNAGHVARPKRHGGCAVVLIVLMILILLVVVGVPLLIFGFRSTAYRAPNVAPGIPVKHRARPTEVDIQTGYPMAVINEMKVIATAEQDFRRREVLDVDGDGTSDYGSLQELNDETPLALEVDSRGTALVDGYLIRVDVTPSGEPGGPAFLCSVRPPVDEMADKRWAEIDQTGKVRMTDPPLAADESEEDHD